MRLCPPQTRRSAWPVGRRYSALRPPGAKWGLASTVPHLEPPPDGRHGPAHIGADAVHGNLQGFCTPGRLIGRDGDVLEQLQEGRTLGDLLLERGIESGQARSRWRSSRFCWCNARRCPRELVQAEFINSIGNRPATGRRRCHLHQIVLRPSRPARQFARSPGQSAAPLDSSEGGSACMAARNCNPSISGKLKSSIRQSGRAEW